MWNMMNGYAMDSWWWMAFMLVLWIGIGALVVWAVSSRSRTSGTPK